MSELCPERHPDTRQPRGRPRGHKGRHGREPLRWGGRLTRADLSGKAGVVKDLAKDKAAWRRRGGARCRVCCAAGPLKNGICEDRAACEERQPALFPESEA